MCSGKSCVVKIAKERIGWAVACSSNRLVPGDASALNVTPTPPLPSFLQADLRTAVSRMGFGSSRVKSTKSWKSWSRRVPTCLPDRAAIN